jgi:DNA helicase-2/ATP-dependent DNA helicase PcrA
MSRSEIAILYRSNAQSRVIEHALFAAGLPYTVYGGLRYFQRAEVKHAIAYLQLMDNPHNDSAFMRVVNFPTRGIGARSIEQLQMAADAHGVSLYAAVPHMTGKAGTSLSNFVKLIESARFETQQLPLPEMVRVVLERSTLLAHYEKEKEGAERIENLQQMVSAATHFVQEEGFGTHAPAHLGPQALPSSGEAIVNADGIELLDADAPLATVMSPLSAFLAHASLEAGDAQAQAGQEAMQLMTVHSAKGLEFDAVFITGLEEGLFPHAPVHELYPAAHAARPDPLQHEVTLLRRAAGGVAEVAVAARADQLVQQPQVEHRLGRRQLPRRRQRQPDRFADQAEVQQRQQ